jgi:hypothetical protein
MINIGIAPQWAADRAMSEQRRRRRHQDTIGKLTADST